MSLALFSRNFTRSAKLFHRFNFELPVASLTSSGVDHRCSSTTPNLPENFQILKPVENTTGSSALKIKNISKAMKAYLERARKHDEFMKTKNEEFEIGRHHLCNMMGLDIGSLTQHDIDRAIEYLLPSGLYEKHARPIMKPPDKLYPKEKAAQFAICGRPFSSFFYTGQNNYYEALHELVVKFHELDAYEDKMLEKGIREPPKESVLKLSGGDWITLDEMRELFLEKISEEDYSFLITTLIRLAAHPYSFRCKDTIWKFRKDFEDMSTFDNIPELLYDENGRPYMEMTGYRRRSEARVIVRGNGTGKVKINDKDISYFLAMQDRESVMFPLEFTDRLGKVDIEIVVTGPGGPTSSHAGAIRYGLALCLRSFVAPEVIEKMRLAGLLTRDRRRRGRKKPGQKGCRAKYKWLKR